MTAPKRRRLTMPHEAEPAAPQPDAAPATPPPVEAAPTPSADTISDDDLVSALKIILVEGATQKTIRKRLGVSKERAVSLLAEMEARGIIGPAPKPGKSREILVSEWPPANEEKGKEDKDDYDTDWDDESDLDDNPDWDDVAAWEEFDEDADTAPVGTTIPNLSTPARIPTRTDAEETPPIERETEPSIDEQNTKESLHWYETPRRMVTDAAKRFLSRFRGEVQSEQNPDYKANMTDVAKNLATGFLSVVGSYTGVKVLVDLPAWLYQKYWTNPEERQRIKEALASTESEVDETQPTPLEQKKARLEEAINGSKFLAQEKKTELLAKLHDTVETYEHEDRALRVERDEEIAKLLDEAIQTRVKNTQVLKESLNSALMVSGLAAMRGVAYGSVAAYERYKQVAQERKEGTREGSQFKEWIVNGFKETVHNLVGGGAETWTGKGLNFAKGATNVLRAAGFADLAISEMMDEGSPGAMIEASLKAFEEKGALSAAGANIAAPWERIGSLFGGGDAEPTEAQTQTQEPGGGGDNPPGAENTQELAAVDDTNEQNTESSEVESSPAFTEAAIETGTVQKGDGIIKILERQGVESKEALELARKAELVRTGGDTRLTTEAIGRLSILTTTSPDGELTMSFHDSVTGDNFTPEEIRTNELFTYNVGTVPGEIPTEAEAVAHVPETTAPLVDSDNVPNDLLNGTFHLYTDANGVFNGLDPGEDDMNKRMIAALKELEDAGHGQSAEAQFIYDQYLKIASSSPLDTASSEPLIPPTDTVRPAATELEATRVAALPQEGPVEALVDDEPLKRFHGESTKVKFRYNRDGEVKGAFIPAYTPKKADVEAALNDWGLTRDDVHDKFFEGHRTTNLQGEYQPSARPEPQHAGQIRPTGRDTSPDTLYRNFTKMVERLDRQEATLREMEEQGLTGTSEYAYWKDETQQFEGYVTDEMKKEFGIQERPI
jgi:hypothetical protein